MGIYTTKEEREVEVQEAKPKLKEPSMYQVIMHNDDFTPMEFVVAVLELFFNMERALAIKTMYEVHTKGKAVCGVFSKDVAETKMAQVMEYASQRDYPLLCTVEAI